MEDKDTGLHVSEGVISIGGDSDTIGAITGSIAWAYYGCMWRSPTMPEDMAAILDHLVPENQRYYLHTLEGSDDMPAHAKSALVGVSLTIPITCGRLNLGTWQGIYLCEFRDYGGSRRIVATIYE